MKISTVQQMREMDQRAVIEYGIAEELLMENAGAAALAAIRQVYDLKNKKILIFCGVGNNGGDGLVLARRLHSDGREVMVVIIGDPSKFKGAAKLNYEIAGKIRIKIFNHTQIKKPAELIAQHDILVDAIFGTGLDREVDGVYKAFIDQINASAKAVVSLDIPSGIQGDSGQVLGCAVQANATITFGLPKTGNLLYPGYAYAGKLFISHISFPPAVYAGNDLQISTNDPLPMPRRRADAHKGECGKALFIAGSANYFGAPYFAAQSFLRAGGGLAYLATTESLAPFIGSKGSEIIFLPQQMTREGSIALKNKTGLIDFSEGVDLVVIGPGLSLQAETQQLVRELAAEIRKPLILDGDGLTAIARDLPILKKRMGETILTPHPGEMLRLTKMDSAKLQQNRIEILQKTCAGLRSVIVLKGAHSLVGCLDGRVYINLTGNPGMATAGSGDVLSGTIAAMYGLGFSIENSLRMGVFIHGLAGDLAAGRQGEDGLVAGDILDHLPEALRMMRTDIDSVYEDHYRSLHCI